MARARRGDLGGARAPSPVHALEGHGLGRLRPCRAQRRGARARRPRSTAGARSATRCTTRSAALGFDPELGAFTQSYGSKRLDASLLMMPLVGFLPADDPRVVGTVAAIERDLVQDGLVERYRADGENVAVDGLPPGEGTFLPCSFWLVQVLALQGRLDEAERLFERLLALRNDLGLLSEEYDTVSGRLVGNFPQAFTHLALVDAAITLDEGWCRGPGRSARRAPHRERARDRAWSSSATATSSPEFCDGAPPCTPTSSATWTTSSGRTRAGSAGGRRGRVEQLALLYDEPDPPVLLALAERPSRAWPTCCGRSRPGSRSEVYAHLSPGLIDALEPRSCRRASRRCTASWASSSRRASTGTTRAGGSPVAVRPRRGRGVLRRAYPGTWFQPRMLETGRYVGIRGTASSCASPVSTSGRRRGASPRSGTSPPCRRCVAPDWRRPRAPGSAGSARRRDRRDLAQRPRRQRRCDPRLREARVRPRGRLRRGAARTARER